MARSPGARRVAVVPELGSFTMPDRPLENGWAQVWDDDALEYRLERFGLQLKKTSQGYNILNRSTGKHVSLPLIGYEALHQLRAEICEFIEDLELAETIKRSQQSIVRHRL
jgi:hypothetical protein